MDDGGDELKRSVEATLVLHRMSRADIEEFFSDFWGVTDRLRQALKAVFPGQSPSVSCVTESKQLVVDITFGDEEHHRFRLKTWVIRNGQELDSQIKEVCYQIVRSRLYGHSKRR